MKFGELIVPTVLSFILSCSVISPGFASAKEGDSTPNTTSVTQSNLESKELDLAKEIAKSGKVIEYSESDNFDFKSINQTTAISSGIVPFANEPIEGGSSYDGYYTNDYTIPGYITGSAAGTITAWALANTTWNPVIIGGIVSVASGYAGKDVRVKSTVYYTWVTKYTKCKYTSTSKIYVSGKYKKTTTKTWTGSVDSNID